MLIVVSVVLKNVTDVALPYHEVKKIKLNI